jgi:hypothetical protein
VTSTVVEAAMPRQGMVVAHEARTGRNISKKGRKSKVQDDVLLFLHVRMSCCSNTLENFVCWASEKYSGA